MKQFPRLDLRSFALGLAAAVCASCAGDYNGTSKTVATGGAEAGALKDRLEAAVGQAPEDVRPAKAAGLMEAKWGSNYAYVTADGRYVIFGDMLDLDTREEVTEGQRRGDRLEALADLGAANTIEFAPASPKYTVTVFTDVDCGYCRMLHRQIADYNNKGIAIRYVFFPRSGPNTDSFRKAEAVWCAADRKAALTAAKASGEIAGDSSCPNPIMREYQLGARLGVHGTPMLVLPNGEAQPGYLPPEQLLAKLVSSESGNPVAAN